MTIKFISALKISVAT